MDDADLDLPTNPDQLALRCTCKSLRDSTDAFITRAKLDLSHGDQTSLSVHGVHRVMNPQRRDWFDLLEQGMQFACLPQALHPEFN